MLANGVTFTGVVDANCQDNISYRYFWNVVIWTHEGDVVLRHQALTARVNSGIMPFACGHKPLVERKSFMAFNKVVAFSKVCGKYLAMQHDTQHGMTHSMVRGMAR